MVYTSLPNATRKSPLELAVKQTHLVSPIQIMTGLPSCVRWMDTYTQGRDFLLHGGHLLTQSIHGVHTVGVYCGYHICLVHFIKRLYVTGDLTFPVWFAITKFSFECPYIGFAQF